jgi:hypothetical protein
VLRGIHREYPNKLDHVLAGPEEVLSPRRLHPAFYGCFDWHSSVHGHWLLARVLRLFPALSEANEIVRALDASLTAENIAAEAAYLRRPLSGTFERTYGWAWLLKLAAELRLVGAGPFARWAAALEPLAAAFVERYLAYLPKATYPIRTGVHPNSAFGLAFAHDYAEAVGHEELRELTTATALRFFAADAAYPAHLEPGGSDFFSPALMEADLMRRVMPRGEFRRWFAAFLPGAGAGKPAALFTPAAVSDRGDYQIVHLDGLNLSRAWCFRNLAAAVEDGRVAERLRAAASEHAEAGLRHVCSGDYGGEHWLATFAVLALTGE